MIVTDWQNLYNGKWKGEITEQSFKHPAKYSQKLIQKIYNHALEEGWIYPGATVLDPFGGVGLGAIYSMLSGVNWIGVEIEPRFHKLAEENIALWERKYRSMNLGTAKVILGDSRYIINGNFDLSLSSPPYAETRLNHDGIEGAGHNDSYGEADGQMGRMKAGNFELAISSPPYGDIAQSGGEKGLKERNIGLTGGERCFSEYGESEGQLGRMKMKDDDNGTFWIAAKTIVTSVFNSLKPGGHSVWVVKNYIKDKELILFCDQWRALCESCGFKTIHMHKAWMVKNMGTQISLDGEYIQKERQYKSFFRVLNEKKGAPRIDWEIVWCMEK
jgi:hypothetical protein